MNKLEKIFKNRFQNKASTEGVDADNLWAAIEDNLANDPKKGAFNKQQKWVLLLLVCLFSTAFYLYKSIGNNNNHDEEALIQTDKIIASTASENEYSHINKVKKPNHSTTIERSAQKAVQTDKDKEQAKRISLLPKKINSPFKNDNEAGLLSLLQAREEALKQNLSQAEVVHLSAPNPIPAYQPNHEPTQQQRQSQQQTPLVGQNKTLVFQQEGDVQSSPLPAEKYLQTDKQTELLPSLLPSVVMTTVSNTPEWPYYQPSEPSVPKRKSSKLPLELGLYTGVNTVATRYENTALSEELAEATSQSMGVFSSFRISYLLDDRYTVNSGIDYEVTQNIFEKIVSKNTVILDTNRLINYGIDPQTGDTINAVRGEVLLDAVETRTVLHYNRFKAISIPISFGMRKQFGQLGVGVNLGVSYNFFIDQKGKTLDNQGNIYAFDENTTAAVPFKKSFFAFQLNPYFDIAVSDHLRLRINPVLKYQMQGRSSLYEVGQNSILMGLSGGVVFSL